MNIWIPHGLLWKQDVATNLNFCLRTFFFFRQKCSYFAQTVVFYPQIRKWSFQNHFHQVFLVWLAFFGCLYYYGSFSDIKWSILSTSFFRWTRELNSRPRTMAQTVSPWCSPLDHWASPRASKFLWEHSLLKNN